MNINRMIYLLILMVSLAIPTGSPLATGGDAATVLGLDNVDPVLGEALTGGYLAAKEADTLHPLSEVNKAQAAAAQPPKRTRDPLMQMVAVGLGAAAGMLTLNYFSGGTVSSSSFYGFTTMMFGGMLGDYAYRKYYAPPAPIVPAGVAHRVSPNP
ncbi:hypothetical protein TI04_01665 [Achromatium sp. WMS2]|nr:hypothetical protein TI04_01665 [Achromatium sp. WMS2]